MHRNLKVALPLEGDNLANVADDRRYSVSKEIRHVQCSINNCKTVSYVWSKICQLFSDSTEKEVGVHGILSLNSIKEFHIREVENSLKETFLNSRRLPSDNFKLLQFSIRPGPHVNNFEWRAGVTVRVSFDREPVIVTDEQKIGPMNLDITKEELYLKMKKLEDELAFIEAAKNLWNQFMIAHSRPMNKSAIARESLSISDCVFDLEEQTKQFKQIFTESNRLSEKNYTIEDCKFEMNELKKDRLTIEVRLSFNRKKTESNIMVTVVGNKRKVELI